MFFDEGIALLIVHPLRGGAQPEPEAYVVRQPSQALAVAFAAQSVDLIVDEERPERLGRSQANQRSGARLPRRQEDPVSGIEGEVVELLVVTVVAGYDGPLREACRRRLEFREPLIEQIGAVRGYDDTVDGIPLEQGSEDPDGRSRLARSGGHVEDTTFRREKRLHGFVLMAPSGEGGVGPRTSDVAFRTDADQPLPGRFGEAVDLDPLILAVPQGFEMRPLALGASGAVAGCPGCEHVDALAVVLECVAALVRGSGEGDMVATVQKEPDLLMIDAGAGLGDCDADLQAAHFEQPDQTRRTVAHAVGELLLDDPGDAIGADPSPRRACLDGLVIGFGKLDRSDEPDAAVARDELTQRCAEGFEGRTGEISDGPPVLPRLA